MPLQKAKSFLDKINTSFSALTTEVDTINIDILKAYVRIFYSTLAEIPVKSYSNPLELTQSPPTQIEESPKQDKKEIEFLILKDKENQNDPNNTNSHQDLDIENENLSHQIITSNKQLPVQEAHHSSLNSSSQENSLSKSSNIEENKIELNHHEKQIEPSLPHEVLVLPQIIEQASLNVYPSVDELLSTKDNNFYTTTNSEPIYNTNKNVVIQELFRDKSPTGLADFLGLSPLDDLKKAWGLNEKILIIRELFSDDVEMFEQTCDQINKFTTFQEAKSYLINHIISKNSWNDVQKFKKASDFILQVKRRFA